MEIKKQNSFTALCFSEKTTLAGIFKYVRVKARELYQDAAENQLEIAGPVYWIYTGMDGNPETIFNLDILIPVSKPERYNGNFKLKTVDPINCLFFLHSGSWEKLPDTYGQIFRETAMKHYSPTGTCREVYIHMDFENPENNLTEVQIGIQN